MTNWNPTIGDTVEIDDAEHPNNGDVGVIQGFQSINAVLTVRVVFEDDTQCYARMGQLAWISRT